MKMSTVGRPSGQFSRKPDSDTSILKKKYMHFAVDAHAIGRRLTGNEVYVRNLLEGFAALDTTARFTAYYSVPEALERIPARFRKRQVACDPFLRLGLELSWKLYQDAPDLLHVQYTSPLFCPVSMGGSFNEPAPEQGQRPQP